MLFTCPVSEDDDVPADDVVIWLGSKVYSTTVPGREVQNNRKKCLKDWILRTGEGAWARAKRTNFRRSKIGKALEGGTLRWVLVDVTLPRAPHELAWTKTTAVASDQKSVHIAVTAENLCLLFPPSHSSIIQRAWRR